MEYGEVVNGLKTKLWVERYRNAGEFKFTADVSSDVRTVLPIGAFITHMDTLEIMIVENHEISDEKGKESELIVSGRGLETDFEQRVVGSNIASPSVGLVGDYALTADETWDQAVTILKDHLYAAMLLDDDNEWPYLTITTDIPAGGTSVARSIKRDNLHKSLLDLLSIDEVGVKVIRPTAAEVNTTLLIHKGVDRSSQFVFSYDTGEIESADYLWTNKASKNSAFVSGKWVQVWVEGPQVGYARRVLQLDASDIDNSFSAAPAGADLTAVVVAMTQRGTDAIAAQNDISLTKAEVSREVNQNRYRVDFNVGDLVTIQGDYNEVSKMRISEYVEIEDQNGYVGYPTLTMT